MEGYNKIRDWLLSEPTDKKVARAFWYSKIRSVGKQLLEEVKSSGYKLVIKIDGKEVKKVPKRYQVLYNDTGLVLLRYRKTENGFHIYKRMTDEEEQHWMKYERQE